MTRNQAGVGDEDGSPAVLDGETTLVRLDRPRASESTRLAVLADSHVASEATGTWKVFHRTEANLRRAVATVESTSVDGLVVAGDLTKDGEPRNFDRYDELVAPLDLPTVTVPGNHDVPKTFDDHEAPPLDAFVERYAPDGYPVRTQMGAVDVIGLNSAASHDESLRDTWGGAVSDRQLDGLDSMLADAETPLVVLHHNLNALPDNPGGKWSNFPLDNADTVHAVLREHDVALAISGHQHVPALGVRDGVRELIAPAICSYPHAVLFVETGPSGTTVTMVPLAPDAEAREGYRLGTDGVPMGRSIVRKAEQRVSTLPLEGTPRSEQGAHGNGSGVGPQV